jgi:hypothetical protein
MEKRILKFCPKFLDLYASIYGRLTILNNTKMSTGQCDLHHLCVVSTVFLIKFKKNLVLTFKQFRSNTKLQYLRFMRDKQGRKKKKKKKNNTRNWVKFNLNLAQHKKMKSPNLT